MGLFKRKKRSWTNLDVFSGRSTSSGISLTDDDVIGIPAVFSCVRVLAESVGSLPLVVYERDDKGNKDRAREFSLYRILHDEPNPWMTSLELREMLMGHLCLRGNAYCVIERESGEVVALWPLHPDRVTIETVGRELVYTHILDGAEKKYKAGDILHIRGLSSDGIVGYSPLTLCRDTWGAAKAAADYSAAYFKNDAAPSGALVTPNSLSADAHSNLKTAWNEGFSGPKNKHKVAILDGGLEWKNIGISPEDSQMIETLKFNTVQIARIFRVPLNLIQDLERSTYDNISQQNRSFLIHTLHPWLRRIEQAINKSLLTESEKARFFVEHVTADFLRGETKERYLCYQIARKAGILSVNEIRRMENFNDIGAQGDTYGSELPNGA